MKDEPVGKKYSKEDIANIKSMSKADAFKLLEEHKAIIKDNVKLLASPKRTFRLLRKAFRQLIGKE